MILYYLHQINQRLDLVPVINKVLRLITPRYLRALVLAGTLGAAAVVVPRFMGNTRLLMVYTALWGGALGASILFRNPAIGLVAIIPVAMFVPFSIGTGSQTSINAGVLILGLLIGLWLFEMIVRRRIRLFPSRPLNALLVFSAVCLLAFLFGQVRWFSAQSASTRAQAATLALFLLSFGAVFLVAHQVTQDWTLKWMTWVFIGCGAYYFIGQIIPTLYSFTSEKFQNGATGAIFWTWLAPMAVAQLVFNCDLKLLQRLSLALFLLAFFYAAFVMRQSWVSAWMPALAGLLAILVAKKPQFLILGLIGAMVVFLVYYDKVVAYIMVGDNEYSLATRLEAWGILFQIIKVNPIFGVGLANYYGYSALFPISGYYVPFNSHNNYIDIIAQTGLLGLGCFLWFVVEIGWLGWRIKDSAPEGFQRAYVYGVIGGLVGTVTAGMLGDWVIPFLYNIGMDGFRSALIGWLFLGGLIAIQKINSPFVSGV